MKNIHAWLLSINILITSAVIGIQPVFADTYKGVETPLISTLQSLGESTESTENTGSGASSVIYTTDKKVVSDYHTTPYVNGHYIRLGVTSDALTFVNKFHLFYYKSKNNSQYSLCWWQYDNEYGTGIAVGEPGTTAVSEWSDDKLNWSKFSGTVYRLDSEYQYTDGDMTGAKLHFRTFSSGYTEGDKYGAGNLEPHFTSEIPRIVLQDGHTVNTILAVISGNLDYLPWNFTDSSGGRHFEDGTSLTPEQNRTYENVFVVMDSNNDNSITEEEVNTYNTTYNTNYNYQDINSGENFDEWTFLNYIAILFANGQDVPGSGGSGEGGEGGSGSGGYGTIQQQQKIESGAVEVNVTTGDMVNENSAEFINTIINGSPSGQNSFEGAISNMRGFINVASEFTALAGAVLSFLPGWLVGLFELLFTVTIVMAIFRLIHLFI